MISSRATPGTSSTKRWDSEIREAAATAVVIGASPRNMRQHAEDDQHHQRGGDRYGPAIEGEPRLGARRVSGKVGHGPAPDNRQEPPNRSLFCATAISPGK